MPITDDEILDEISWFLDDNAKWSDDINDLAAEWMRSDWIGLSDYLTSVTQLMANNAENQEYLLNRLSNATDPQEAINVISLYMSEITRIAMTTAVGSTCLLEAKARLFEKQGALDGRGEVLKQVRASSGYATYVLELLQPMQQLPSLLPQAPENEPDELLHFRSVTPEMAEYAALPMLIEEQPWARFLGSETVEIIFDLVDKLQLLVDNAPDIDYIERWVARSLEQIALDHYSRYAYLAARMGLPAVYERYLQDQEAETSAVTAEV